MLLLYGVAQHKPILRCKLFFVFNGLCGCANCAAVVLRGSPTFSFTVISLQLYDVFSFSSLDNEQFLCDNFYVANIFDRVHGKTNIVNNSNISAPLIPLDSRGTHPCGRLGTTNDCDYLLHFIWRVIYTSNFPCMTTFICHIKANTPAFHQMYLPHKNWTIFVVDTSK